ncbi:GDSL esterase/lipase [Tanacetum coccineum]
MGSLYIIPLRMIMVVIMFLALTGIRPANALTVAQIRLIATKNNVSGVFVFGDSSVDPGNNNGLKTDAKSNFPPYGMDFFSGHPTGRFSNGRLATDYIAEALGYTKEFDPIRGRITTAL